MHSVKRILTTENRTCAIRPTAIQSAYLIRLYELVANVSAWRNMRPIIVSLVEKLWLRLVLCNRLMNLGISEQQQLYLRTKI